MRLVKQVARLETGAAGAALVRVDPAPVEVCWSKHELRIDYEDLAPGEYIAVDVRVDDVIGEEGSVAGCTRLVTITERVTRSEYDLGWVTDRDGRRIGRVNETDGSLISYGALTGEE